ncbi:ABC transporter substrate-binding protein [Corynebacterium mendelii]|uniref:Probable sugar-binding periplasmic protein n=1 Tax=Corynebacterium mendelii TaxID=2765362 RepID=A0A939E1Y7_9CORY|nr:ABC transporter substrate-binding protein [Corynebacterium mendelii]MBN9643982.1 carbohydrate ABC transporter substrate-binding protein [Corynebacterium mendelii]
MRRVLAVCAAAALSVSALTACSGSDDQGSGSTDSGSGSANQVNVVTWWSAGSEKKGLEALVEVFNEQHPDTEFVNEAISGGSGDQAKQKLQTDLAAKNPPDTYQAHAGAELSSDIAAGYLEDVSGLYDEFKLREAFPDSLIERLTVDGKIYSVPSNVHRANVVWANVKVLEEAGLDPSTPADSIDAWIEDMQKIKDSGKQPITVGSTWTQLQLLETILIADLGADDYNKLMAGDLSWDDAAVTTAFKHFDTIMNMTDKGLWSQDWEPAMAGVVSEDSVAYNVMGDWAVAAFDSSSKKAGEDYVYFPVPGTAGVFDFLADSFTKPVGAKHPEGTNDWLNTISSKEGQIAFNKVKGSIPARSDLTDAEIAEFPEYQQSAMKDFGTDTIVSSIAHGAALPLPVTEKMKKAIGQYDSGAMDVAGLQQAFADAAK